METIAILNPDKLTDEEVSKFAYRGAARAVIFDADKNIGLFHISTRRYYKLPGGGIEEGEDVKEALKRECQEELGCEIEIDGEIGKIIEYRQSTQLRQESFCFYGHVVGEKGNPNYTESELEHGLKLRWVKLDEAIRLSRESEPLCDAESFIIQREAIILNKLKEII